jgi:hypothetical protein
VFGDITRACLNAAYFASCYKCACNRATTAAVALFGILDEAVPTAHSFLAVVVLVLETPRRTAAITVQTICDPDIRGADSTRVCTRFIRITWPRRFSADYARACAVEWTLDVAFVTHLLLDRNRPLLTGIHPSTAHQPDTRLTPHRMFQECRTHLYEDDK